MKGCDSFVSNAQSSVGPTECHGLISLLLSFIPSFRSHTDLKRATSSLRILIGNVVYEDITAEILGNSTCDSSG